MIESYSLVRLNAASVLKPFNCGNKEADQDLNEFFLKDSKQHALQLLAVTYALESAEETIAYFSVLNDSIRHSDTQRKVFKLIPHGKRGYKSHPAVKVGRFAVNKNYQGRNIGSEF